MELAYRDTSTDKIDIVLHYIRKLVPFQSGPMVNTKKATIEFWYFAKCAVTYRAVYRVIYGYGTISRIPSVWVSLLCMHIPTPQNT